MALRVTVPFQYPPTGPADGSKTNQNFSALLAYLNSTTSGSGSVGVGATGQLAYYAGTGNSLSPFAFGSSDQFLGMNHAGTALAWKSETVFNVKNYGAVGDGTTDDTTAIQAAIDAAKTAGGATVLLPPGKYKTTATLNIKATNSLTFAGTAMGDDRISLGYNPGSTILSTANPAISLDNSGSSTLRTNNVVLRDFTLKRLNEDTIGNGIEIPADVIFHGNFKFINLGVYYFENGLYARYCGWLAIDKCVFQRNINGIDVQCNIFNAISCLFYQNGSYSGSDYNNMTFAANDGAGGAGAKLSVNAASMVSCDLENNAVGLLVYSSSLAARSTLSLVSCYFEHHSKIAAAIYNANLSMETCFNSNAEHDTFYFDSSRVNLNGCFKLTCIQNESDVSFNRCVSSTMVDIYAPTPTDYTTAWQGGVLSRPGIPDDIYLPRPEHLSMSRITIADFTFSTTNATNTLNTDLAYNPFERNTRTITSTASSGHASCTITTALSSSLYFALTMVVHTVEGSVGWKLVDIGTSTTLIQGSSVLFKDTNDISTFQIWGTGITTTGNVRLDVYPNVIGANSGTAVEIYALGVYANEVLPVTRLPLGAPFTWVDDAPPTDGYHQRYETVRDKTPSADGNIGWVCTAGGTPGTWTLYGPVIDGADIFKLSGTQTATGNKTFSGTVKLSNLTASTVPYLDASKIFQSSATTPTELGYLSGVTSAIQTQFTGKASTALDNLSSVAINTSLLPTSDNSIDLGSTSKDWRSIYFSTSLKNGATTLATATEVGYLSGVTSAIQTQFTGKAGTALDNLASVAINTSLLPASDNAIDLGSTSKNWRSIYLSTSLKNGSTTLATATELGYLTGVTSAIQTQIDGKASNAESYVTIANTSGLTSERVLTGTSNQITITDNGAGSTVVLATPQNIHSAATPTFASETLTSTTNQLVLGTTRTVTVTAPTPATTSRVVTIPDLAGDYSVLGTIGNQSKSGTLTITAASNTAVLSSVSHTGTLGIFINNLSNTSSANANFQAAVAGTSAGDPSITFEINSGSSWIVGGDNSDSDKFKVCQATSIGTNDFLTITTAGQVALGSGTSATNVRINSQTATGSNTATMTNSPTTGDPAVWIVVNINGTDRKIPAWA